MNEIVEMLLYMIAAGGVIYVLSEKLEKTGTDIGNYLRIPMVVIASTFAAVATSGPEILISVITSTDGYISSGWDFLSLSEKATAGPLNMSFSAMDNLLGIFGLAAIILMLAKRVRPRDQIEVPNSVKISLGFYIVISMVFTLSIWDGIMTPVEAYMLASIAAFYLLFLIFAHRLFEDGEENKEETPFKFMGFLGTIAMYSILIWGSVEMIKIVLGSTFGMAQIGVASVGAVLLALTSYVSSFPELGMTYVMARKGNVKDILGMLFGSNVIDLGFSGLRPIVQNTEMAIFTTGTPGLLQWYIAALPATAVIISLIVWKGKLKYWMAIPGGCFYLAYILGGWIYL